MRQPTPKLTITQKRTPSPRPSQPGETLSQRSALTPDQKQRRVVLKRVNIDRNGAPRADFFKAGTVAKGAAETGAVEAYMCAKVGRLVRRRLGRSSGCLAVGWVVWVLCVCGGGVQQSLQLVQHPQTHNTHKHTHNTPRNTPTPGQAQPPRRVQVRRVPGQL
jgi:hypothetical protein